jgi:hypothetical protein
LDVDFSDAITGMGTNWDRLVIFTDYSAYFYDQSTWKNVWDTGCCAHQTIKTSGAYMLWANSDGVWISTGGQPQNIAGEIIDFIRAGNPRNFFAEIVDEEYHLYVGDVTVDGVDYTNCTKIFNIPTSAWRTREYYNNITTFARFNDSCKQRLHMGSDTGEVWDKGKYTDATLYNMDAIVSAAGKAIGANFELPPIHLNDISINKKLHNIYVYANRAQGLALQARVIDRNLRILTPYMPIGKLDKYVNTFQIEAKKGVILQIAGSEYGKLPYFSFYGFMLDVEKDSDILKTK